MIRTMTTLILLSASPLQAWPDFGERFTDDKAITLPEEYQSWDGCEKQEYLWQERIVPSEYESMPTWGIRHFISPSSLNLGVSYNRDSDELPRFRNKIFHPLGSVAKISFEPVADSPYTGLFQGACGLIRLSWAEDPKMFGYLPGAAIKLFVDGEPSENVHLIPELKFSDNEDFMEPPLRSHLSEPQNPLFKLAIRAIAATGLDPLTLDLYPFATKTLNSKPVDQPVAPFELQLRAPASLRGNVVTGADFRSDLHQLDEGSVVYEVLARSKPDAELNLIGYVQLTSQFVASRYGDQRLFFKHNGRRLDNNDNANGS